MFTITELNNLNMQVKEVIVSFFVLMKQGQADRLVTGKKKNTLELLSSPPPPNAFIISAGCIDSVVHC